MEVISRLKYSLLYLLERLTIRIHSFSSVENQKLRKSVGPSISTQNVSQPLILLFLTPLTQFICIGLQKYNESIFNECIELFRELPIAAFIEERHLFCVSGGLSPRLTSVCIKHI